MIISKIELVNFRNHNSLKISPTKGLNVIVADNGKGKTNILEALYYCSFGKSFRTNEDEDLINKNSENFYIYLTIEDTTKHELCVSYSKGNKKFLLDRKPLKRISDINKYLNVLLFEPRFVNLFTGIPSERRILLDLMISKTSSKYLELLKRYRALLKERNLSLKQEQVDKTYVFTLTNEMVALSSEITAIRLSYVKSINDVLSKIAKQISNKKQSLEIVYKSLIPFNETYTEDLLRMYQVSYENDLAAKITTIGIHKEDYQMLLDGQDLTKLGSQGENRLCALSFVLAPYFLKNESKPIVVLDDVLSELDEINQKHLLDFVTKFEQTFITTTSSILVGNEFKL